MSNKNTQNNGAVDCIRCDVPVCIAAGFSPERKKNMKKKIHIKYTKKIEPKYTIDFSLSEFLLNVNPAKG